MQVKAHRARRNFLTLAALAASLHVALPAAHAAGDAARGAYLFDQECSDCHSTKAGKSKKGPALFGVVGRKAATISDFNYSDAMQASGLTWTAEQIEAYIAAPRKAVPGGKMKYDGLPDEKARADVLAFLATLR